MNIFTPHRGIPCSRSRLSAETRRIDFCRGQKTRVTPPRCQPRCPKHLSAHRVCKGGLIRASVCTCVLDICALASCVCCVRLRGACVYKYVQRRARKMCRIAHSSTACHLSNAGARASKHRACEGETAGYKRCLNEVEHVYPGTPHQKPVLYVRLNDVTHHPIR